MKSIDILNKPVDECKFCVVDFETTGMMSGFNRIKDIGVIIIEKGKIVNKYQRLVNPEQRIPWWISEFTGLYDYHVKNKPTFAYFSEELLSILSDCVFVAHNASFDYPFLKEEMKRQNIIVDFFTICTVKLSRVLIPNLPNHNLDTLSEYLGLKIINRHRALPDAQATAELFLHLLSISKKQHNCLTIKDLIDLENRKPNTFLHSSSRPPLF